MPFAYAVGTAVFRHLTLQVDRRVLIPRPETELLVDLALAATGGRGRIADLCTGSGAVALALASEGSYECVIGTDISPDALDVARANLVAIPEDRRRLVDFRLGDLTEPLGAERVTAVVANPPYIAAAERAELPPSVRDWEPELALFSGDDGMQAIARIISGAADVVLPGGFLVIEIDARRSARAQALATTDGRWSDVQLRPDLTGRERFLAARRLPPR
jgi:release factor glutamine methyltransferase